MLKKWIRILRGKSDLHVNQAIGKIYSRKEIKGYYNDLTQKVNWHGGFDKNGIPLITRSGDTKIYFPTTIFQYALGNYDLYLISNKTIYFKQFQNSLKWLIDNQNNKGGWNISTNLNVKYSALTQGEGISVLARAFIESQDNKYLNIANKATKLLIKSVENGGTARYIDDKIYFEENVQNELSLILNGWIFAIFGLFDILKVNNEAIYDDILNKALTTLKKELKNYDCGYWSFYDQQGHLASPFYHKLHIAQLEVLYDLFDIKEFKTTSERWKQYLSSGFKKNKAIIIKIFQKLKEPGELYL